MQRLINHTVYDTFSSLVFARPSLVSCLCVFLTCALISCFHSPTLPTCFRRFSYSAEYTCANSRACILTTQAHPLTLMSLLYRGADSDCRRTLASSVLLRSPGWGGGVPEAGTVSCLSQVFLVSCCLDLPCVMEAGPAPLCLAVFLWNSGLL